MGWLITAFGFLALAMIVFHFVAKAEHKKYKAAQKEFEEKWAEILDEIQRDEAQEKKESAE